MAASKAVCRQIENLRTTIAHHEECYRHTLVPEITDEQFDALVDQLKALEMQYPELKQSQPIVGDSPLGRASYPHAIPMLSLDRVYDPVVIQDYLAKAWKVIQTSDNQDDVLAIVAPKLDGVPVSITYVNGKLQRILTRGRAGLKGQDVTSQVQHVRGVLPAIMAMDTVIVRGEVVIPLTAYHAYLFTHGQSSFATPRSAAASVVMSNDPALATKLDAAFIPYRIVVDRPLAYRKAIHWCTLQGFHPLPFGVLDCPTPAQDTLSLEYLSKILADWNDWRKSHMVKFATDGIVITLQHQDRETLFGETAHHPRWATAFKWATTGVTASLIGMDYMLSKSGQVTPIALVAPLKIQGHLVKRVPLNNAADIMAKLAQYTGRHMHVDDELIVGLGGDSVPVFQAWGKIGNGAVIQGPEFCPSCKQPLKLTREGFLCTNTFGCEGQWMERLHHFASPKAMHINGLGRSVILQLIQHKKLTCYSDLFRLTELDLYNATKSTDRAAKLHRAIALSKKTTLARLLTGLNIDGIGPTMAKQLAAHFKQDLLALRAVTDPSTFTTIASFNTARAQALLEALVRLKDDLEAFPALGVSWPINPAT